MEHVPIVRPLVRHGLDEALEDRFRLQQIVTYFRSNARHGGGPPMDQVDDPLVGIKVLGIKVRAAAADRLT